MPFYITFTLKKPSLGYIWGSDSSPYSCSWFSLPTMQLLSRKVFQRHKHCSTIFVTWCNWSNMLIRLDKCCTFGMRKQSCSMVQFEPRLYIQSEQIPPNPKRCFIYLSWENIQLWNEKQNSKRKHLHQTQTFAHRYFESPSQATDKTENTTTLHPLSAIVQIQNLQLWLHLDWTKSQFHVRQSGSLVDEDASQQLYTRGYVDAKIQRRIWLSIVQGIVRQDGPEQKIKPQIKRRWQHKPNLERYTIELFGHETLIERYLSKTSAKQALCDIQSARAQNHFFGLESQGLPAKLLSKISKSEHSCLVQVRWWPSRSIVQLREKSLSTTTANRCQSLQMEMISKSKIAVSADKKLNKRTSICFLIAQPRSRWNDSREDTTQSWNWLLTGSTRC